MKTCADCHLVKPFESFSRDSKARDGRYPYCKECASKRNRAAYRARGKHSWVHDKTCKWCQVLKPKNDFRKNDAGKVASRCIACEEEIAQREAEHLKRCNICREWLPHDKFHPSKLGYPNVACAACTRAQVAQPDYKSRRRAFLLQKEYGITPEQYDALVDKQGGNCPICLKPLPPDRGGYVDHVHGGKHKGKIRAVLHGVCNRFVMWEHEDSGQLRRAADLIDNPLTDWMVPGKPSSEVRKQARRKAKERNAK